jgi:hypothetical protein
MQNSRNPIETHNQIAHRHPAAREYARQEAKSAIQDSSIQYFTG